jgi:hypothetical protein
MCVPRSRTVGSQSTSLIFCIMLGLLAPLLFAIRSFATPQSGNTSGLFITPSTVVLQIGEDSAFSAIDETGRPVSNVEWSIKPPIAELHSDNGEIRIDAKTPGRAVLTATANNQIATAIVAVAPDDKLPPATIRWSLDPTPGLETLLVGQAVPTRGGPTFYSVEWSKSSNAIVRALNNSGQQLWFAHLSSTASPLTLKHRVPEPGEVFQNQALLSDHSWFIIGDKGGFAMNNDTDPSHYDLPVDGKNILVRAVGDFSGGLLLLERGRFRDSLVRLSPNDGSESWRVQSEGRLTRNLTANTNDDIGIVETIAKPPSSALLIISAQTGKIRFRIPFPISSSTIDGFRCSDPQHNVLKSIKPSLSGSVVTSNDGNIYVQVETHNESVRLEACKGKDYSFDDSLSLLRVTPAGEAEWKTFQHIHADGNGNFVVQPRVFAGETIPDGFGGVLAAWTYVSPHLGSDKQLISESRLSRIDPSGQQDFTLPMLFWTKGISTLFDENMVLGDGNVLYATNGPLLVRFDTRAGVLDWGRHPPTGEVKLRLATAGGGVLVSNAGRLVYFDAQGNGQGVPWTVTATNPDDIGLVQSDLFDHTSAAPLQIRDVLLCWAGNFIAVEDGAPYGRGGLIYFENQ